MDLRVAGGALPTVGISPGRPPGWPWLAGTLPGPLPGPGCREGQQSLSRSGSGARLVLLPPSPALSSSHSLSRALFPGPSWSPWNLLESCKESSQLDVASNASGRGGGAAASARVQRDVPAFRSWERGADGLSLRTVGWCAMGQQTGPELDPPRAARTGPSQGIKARPQHPREEGRNGHKLRVSTRTSGNDPAGGSP